MMDKTIILTRRCTKCKTVKPLTEFFRDRTRPLGRAYLSWESLVGYSVDELKTHLQATMPKEYSWNDYLKGRLHVDHIIPLSTFNITSEDCEDFKRAWCLSNLQLLTAQENLKKNAKILTI